MLQRPEIGTWEHIKLWVASKPQHEAFNWADRHHCAAAEYCLEHYGHRVYVDRGILVDLSILGRELVYKRAKSGRTSTWISWDELSQAMEAEPKALEWRPTKG